MTTSHLYAVYVGAYADAARLFYDGLDPTEVDLAARGAHLATEAERLVAILALHDATDGKPMRSLARFERALQSGGPVLRCSSPIPPGEYRTSRVAVRPAGT